MADTDPSTTPDGIDGPTTHEMLAQLITRVEQLTETVEAGREDLRHVRHAIALIADGELARRQQISMLSERIDTIEREGCAVQRVRHHGGNGGA